MNQLLPYSIILALAFAPVHAEPSAKLQELQKESREITGKIRKAIPDLGAVDPELRKLEQAVTKASEAHQLAIDKHPKLQELNAQMAAANAKLEAATEAKDEAGKAAADEEISKLADRLMEAADKEPELERLGTAMHKATIALMEREDQVRANHPLTKELFARREALQRQIDAELEAHPESETER